MNPFSDTKNPEILLKEAFPDWATGDGVISIIYNPPWNGEVSSQLLDFEYFGNHSGCKFISPLVMKMLDEETHTLSYASRAKLAHLISAKFMIKWEHLWDTYDIEYDPLNNYDITEDTDRTITDTGTDTMTYDTSEVVDEDSTDTGTDTMAYGKTRTTTHGLSTVTKEYVAGFNSTTDPPPLSDRSDTTESGQTPVVDSGNDIETRNLAKTDDITKTKTGTEEQEKDLSKVEDGTVHRYGKIGVTTTQYMIKEDRSVWLWNFFDQVYADVDSILTIAYQDPCAVFS